MDFVKVKLVDNSIILSTAQYNRALECGNISSKTRYVFIPIHISNGAYHEFTIKQGFVNKLGYCVLSKGNIDLRYILFWLNSAYGQVILRYNRETMRFSNLILRSKLDTICIYLGELEDLYYCVILETILERFSEQKEKGTDDFSTLKFNVVSEVRDALILQIVMAEYFQILNLDVYSRWKELADEIVGDSRMANRAFNSLIRVDSVLMSEVRKVRAAIEIPAKMFEDDKTN